jgi:hypothetical protein
MKKYLVTAALLTAGLIAGCGSSSNAPTASVSGKVADGYLVNATVFMDKNGNYQLDPGEPSTVTDMNGAYTLKVDPADMGKYPIVAVATQGITMDKDTGSTVTSSYVLSMPAGVTSGTVNSNFISPLSSQLREMMETGKYTKLEDAMNDLSAKLGVPAGTNMLADYMASNNVGMHTAAQKMANLMGTQAAQVMGSNGGGTVQVDRYRGMMGTIFSNFSSVRGQNSQTAMTNMANAMTAALANIQTTKPGAPYRNMSTAFQGGMGLGMMGR